MSITHYGTTKIDGASGSVDIGVSGNKRIICIFMGDESLPGESFQGTFTVDGKTCTQQLVREQSGGSGTHLELHTIDESGLGASNGSVTISYSGGNSGWGFHVQVWYGVENDTAHDSNINSGSSGNPSVSSIDSNDNGLVVVGVQSGTSSCTYSSWTSPLTERSEGSPGPDGQSIGTAGDVETTGQSAKTYSCTASASDRWVGLAVSFNVSGTEVDNVTSDKANGTYGVSEDIYVQVCFDDAVEVAGTPQLDLDVASGKIDYVRNWIPTDLSSGLEVWLDATDLDQITESGGAVSQLDDKSGNGIDVSQPTGAYQPTIGSRTINGLNALDFAGGGGADYLQSASSFGALNNGPFTIFAVVKLDATGNYYFTGLNQSANNKGLHTGWRDSDSWTMDFYNDAYDINGLTPDTTNPFIAICQYKDPGSEIWFNDTSQGSSAWPQNDLITDSGELNLGCGYNQASNWDGLIAELIMVSGSLSEADFDKIQGYLAWKYGLTASLDSGHTYKNRPPLVS